MDRGSRMDVLLALKHTVENTEGGSLKFLLTNAVKCIEYLEEVTAISCNEQAKSFGELTEARQTIVAKENLIYDYKRKLDAYKKKYGDIDIEPQEDSEEEGW